MAMTQKDICTTRYTARAGKPTGLSCRMRASGSKDPRCMFRTHWCIMSVFGCDPGRDCPREPSGMSGRFSHVPTDCGERTRPGRPVPLHPGRDEKHGRGTGNPTGLSRGRMSICESFLRRSMESAGFGDIIRVRPNHRDNVTLRGWKRTVVAL